MTRSEQILKLIVEHFIKTAEPVGSHTLLETYKLNCSSATIRAEMNKLEKEGLLEKTHASSGRVPSSAGYAYYVEHLREERVDESVKYAIQKILDEKTKSIEEIIKESCEILSNMTNLASVVLGPKVTNEHLVSIQLIPLGNSTATAVFVTDQGYVENKTFILDGTSSLEDVQSTVTLLNERLKGTAISELVPKMEAMKPALTDYLVGQDAVYQALLGAFVKFAGERMDLYGSKNLLDHPEFAEDAAKLKRVLALMDDPEAFRQALEESTPADESKGEVQIKIGAPEEGLDEVAIISTTVQIPGGQNASIALMGPTRIDYEKVVSILNYVTKSLDERFNQGKGEQECQEKKKKPQPPKTEGN